MPINLPALSKRPFVRRTLIGFGSLLGLLVILVLFAYFALPGIVKSQAEQVVAEKLQRRLSIGAIDINPFKLTATIRDVKLMEPQADQLFAGFDTLAVNLSSYSVLRLAPVIQEVRLSKPFVRLVRTDANHYNIDDIVKLVAEQPPSPEPARFSVNNIQVEDGRIEFDDKPVGKTHTVTALKLGIPFVSSLPSQVEVYVEPLLSAMVNDTPMLLKGRARPWAESKDAVVDLNLDGLDVTQLVGYLPFQPGFKVSGARLDAKIEASFEQPKDKAASLLISGTAALKSLVLTEPGGKALLKLPELAITLDKAAVLAQTVAVTSVTVTGLDVDLTRDRNGQFALQRVFAPAKPAPATPAPPANQAAPMYSLAELAIRDASVRYGDEFGTRPLRAGVEKLNLTVRKIAVDTGKQTVAIDNVTSDSANLLVQQGKLGKPAVAPAAAAVSAKAAEGGYVVTVGSTKIENWAAKLEDNGMARPVITNVTPLALSLQEFSTASGTRSKLDLRASVNKVGAFAVDGTVGMAPLHADLKLDMKNVDVLPLQPYFTEQVNLLVTRASVSGKGALQLDQPATGPLKGGFKGDVTVGDLATVDKLTSTDFLRWKSLFFGGVDVKMEPFALSVQQVALTDFYSRIIIDPTGRINLQDIRRAETGAAVSLTDGAVLARAGADGAAVVPIVVPVPAAAAAVAVVPPGAAKGSTARPPITIRKLTLQGGRVRFTDNFIKPNYTANLTDFGGVVSGLSSDPASNATLDMRGSVNSAPVSVAGTINPLKGDLTMDIQANVRGMELAPLTPYSGRYIGYGIEKGKLSFEVAYKIQDRVLTAQNRLILEQLTLGDKIESPTATKLPVSLALALLRDRNGVIDINLPIGGSLDDPQFSVGGLIVKVIVNLLTKAVTAPFALLGSLFGGGEELSWLEFAPGRAAIAPAGEEKLKTLAKALADRPALKLEITGRVDAESDIAGLKRNSIDRKVRAMKLKDMVARGQSGDATSVTVTPEEYPALLARVYKEEKFPKPRNLIGLEKGLPVEEMEKLMVTNASVDDDDLTALGNRRAQAVKDWLQKNGSVPPERMFLLATKPATGDGKDGAKPNRADFSLR